MLFLKLSKFLHTYTPIARFMGPTWGPSGADRTQVGPMLAPWILLSEYIVLVTSEQCSLYLQDSELRGRLKTRIEVELHTVLSGGLQQLVQTYSNHLQSLFDILFVKLREGTQQGKAQALDICQKWGGPVSRCGKLISSVYVSWHDQFAPKYSQLQTELHVLAMKEWVLHIKARTYQGYLIFHHRTTWSCAKGIDCKWMWK